MAINKEKAERVITFVESLHHVKGKWAGQRLILEPWQKDRLLRPLLEQLTRTAQDNIELHL